MAWVVDTSVVVDLVTGDPLFEPAYTACLQAHLLGRYLHSPSRQAARAVPSLDRLRQLRTCHV